MNQKFDELGYYMPDKTPEVYADRAVKILNDLIENNPETAVYVMQPSSVLLFAGLRAISPYHSFDDEVTDVQKKAFDGTLAKHGIHRIGGDKENSFVLVSETGTQDVKNRYDIVADNWSAPNSYDAESFTKWMDVNGSDIGAKLKSGRLPSQWQHDADYTIQNLLFGILLGYPGQAISSAMWAAFNGDPSGMKLSHVIVDDGKQYDGTEVSYDVDPSIVDSDEIIRHKELWTETIRIVEVKKRPHHIR